MPQTVVCLGVGCLGLLLLSPLLAQKPRLRESLEGHTGFVICMVYSPDGKTLASDRAQVLASFLLRASYCPDEPSTASRLVTEMMSHPAGRKFGFSTPMKCSFQAFT